MFRLVILISFFLFGNKFVSGQVADLEKETLRKIEILFGNNPPAASLSVMEYYTKSLVNEVKTELGFESDSVAKQFILDSIIRVKLKFIPGSSVVNKELQEIVRKQVARIKKYNVEYGDMLKSFEIKNGEIEITPSQFQKIYQYTNELVFDTIAGRVKEYSDKFLAAKFNLLNSAGASLAMKELYQQITNGSKEALSSFFVSVNEEAVKKFTDISQSGKDLFNRAKQKFYLQQEGAKQLWAEITGKAEYYLKAGSLKTMEVLERVVNNPGAYDADYLAAKLAEQASRNIEFVKLVQAGDAETITSFLAGVEKQVIHDFDSVVTTKIRNVQEVQEAYKNKFLRNGELIKSELNSFLAKAEVVARENIDLKIVEEGYTQLVNLLPAVSERLRKFDNFLFEKQTQFKQEVNNFYDKYLKDPQRKAEAVVFLASFFTDTKDAEQALKDIRGALPFNQEADEFTLAKERLIETKSDLLNDSRDFLNTAGLVVGSLQALGIGNDKLMADITEGITIAESVVDVASAFASGNVFGGISGIASIFGFGRTDPAAERHKQIMKALKQIDSKLTVMDEKLNQILKNQESIFNLQKETYKRIKELTEIVLTEFDKLNEKFVNLDLKLNYLITKDFVKASEKCVTIAKAIGRYGDYYDEGISYTAINEQLKQTPTSSFVDAEKLFTDNDLLFNDNFNPVFQSNIYDNIYNSVSENQKKSYDDFINKWDRYYDSLNLLAKDFYRKARILPQTETGIYHPLATPVFTYKELRYKLSGNTFSMKAETYPESIKGIDKLISTNASSTYANCILLFHPIITLTDNSSAKPIPVDKHFFRDIRKAQSVKYLYKALRIVNASICQQNMLSGDFLLEQMRLSYKAFLADNDSVLLRKMNYFLNQPYGKNLYENFIRYYILSEIELSQANNNTDAHRVTLQGYSMAYNGSDERIMNNHTVKFPFRAQFIDSAKQKDIFTQTRQMVTKGWNLNIDGVYHSLPAPAEIEISEGFKIKYSQDLFKLLRYRDRLINTIEGYNLYENCSKSQMKQLNYISVSASSNE